MITYERTETGYTKTGELRPGTLTAKIVIDGRESASIFRAKKAVAVCDEAIASGHAKATRYEVIEISGLTQEQVAARSANLLKARKARCA